MRKLLTTAMLLVAPLALAACGEKAEEAAPVEEVATEEVVAEPATDAAATDDEAGEAMAPAEDAAAAGEETATAEPDPKSGPPER
jgi:predicted small lipoprotein YifL